MVGLSGEEGVRGIVWLDFLERMFYTWGEVCTSSFLGRPVGAEPPGTCTPLTGRLLFFGIKIHREGAKGAKGSFPGFGDGIHRKDAKGAKGSF